MYLFMNNVWSNFTKIIYFFCGKIMDQKYVIMSTFRICWPNLDIIAIIMW